MSAILEPRYDRLLVAGVCGILVSCGSAGPDGARTPDPGSDAAAACSGPTCGADAGDVTAPAARDGGNQPSADAGDDRAPPPGPDTDTDGGGSGDADAAPAGTSGLPPLSVSGNKLQDPTGKTIILRGSSLIDIGALYAYGGMSVTGITSRLDKIAAAGVQGHVVRMPVYPEITYNGTSPTCSPVPYPVGSGPSAKCTPKTPLTAAAYVSTVLQPAVDYATGKGLYVIVDFHQIDNATTGTSAADATTFWTDIAPRFASYGNVFYELFNEPIDTSATWATLKPVVQGLIDTVRSSAPNNVLIVPSNSWDQRPGDAASDPPQGTNLMYTAHIYPSNWGQAFQTQVATAVTKAPVFVTEWGYAATNPHSWGTGLQTVIDGDGASWTAWVTDNAWQPNMFTDTAITQLTDFGTLVQSWLAATAQSDWVQ
ncbi:MAG TPA: cellulase family glycosylhydrolase [Polyangiaceae bacterium]|nr:cellulase family glycosylhydrolase [Polyangiaceae bacterium]